MLKTMTNAMLSFKPLEPYFFGGEQTHGDGGANYFAKSNRWPQQSTLCGVVRHLLLETGYDRGKNSFTPEDPKLDDYGDLLELSPLFLIRQTGAVTHYFLRQAIDRHGVAAAPFTATLADTNNLALTPYRSGWQPAVHWAGYDHKKRLVDAWVRSDGRECVDAADIFWERTRPGITKNAGAARRKQEAGFYKQTAYQLAAGWSFGVLAGFREGVDVQNLDGRNLPVGGEKTVFAIAARQDARAFDALFPAAMFYPEALPALPALVLVSDAWAPREVLKHVAGGITELEDFRHIRTHGNVTNFGPLLLLAPQAPGAAPQGSAEKLTKSAKYTLLARGSVLICPDAVALGALETALRTAPWHTIGFNHFITYPPKSK